MNNRIQTTLDEMDREKTGEKGKRIESGGSNGGKNSQTKAQEIEYRIFHQNGFKDMARNRRRKKKEERYVETKNFKNGKESTETVWVSGFGIQNQDLWMTIGNLKSSTIYAILNEKCNPIKDYTRHTVHKTIYEIEKYLNPEERDNLTKGIKLYHSVNNY